MLMGCRDSRHPLQNHLLIPRPDPTIRRVSFTYRWGRQKDALIQGPLEKRWQLKPLPCFEGLV